MKQTAVSLLIYLYVWLLRWYPANFRAEFREEMTTVFAQAMIEAAGRGRWAVTAVYLRELRELPLNLAREHWHSLTEKELAMTTIHKKPEWFFYPAWIILTMLCVPIAFILSLIILKLVIINFVGDIIYVDGVRRITEDYLGMYVFAPIMGLVMGVLQYGLLRRYLPRIGWWVLATSGGWLLGVLLVLLSGRLYYWTFEAFDIDLPFTVLGLSLGVGQWLLLRRRLPRAGWWIGVNIVGWGLLDLITDGSLGQFGLLALGFLPACVTAVTLALLMNQAQPPEPQGV